MMQVEGSLHTQDGGPGLTKKSCISTPAPSNSSEACVRDGEIYYYDDTKSINRKPPFAGVSL